MHEADNAYSIQSTVVLSAGPISHGSLQRICLNLDLLLIDLLLVFFPSGCVILIQWFLWVFSQIVKLSSSYEMFSPVFGVILNIRSFFTICTSYKENIFHNAFVYVALNNTLNGRVFGIQYTYISSPCISHPLFVCTQGMMNFHLSGTIAGLYRTVFRQTITTYLTLQNRALIFSIHNFFSMDPFNMLTQTIS